mgnify:CR=1 FL=1
MDSRSQSKLYEEAARGDSYTNRRDFDSRVEQNSDMQKAYTSMSSGVKFK